MQLEEGGAKVKQTLDKKNAVQAWDEIIKKVSFPFKSIGNFCCWRFVPEAKQRRKAAQGIFLITE